MRRFWLIFASILTSMLLLSTQMSPNGSVYAIESAEYSYDWPMLHHDPNRTGYTLSTAPNTNTTLWIYTISAGVWTTSPAVADGRLYIGCEDRNVYCLNATTGAYIWSYKTGDYMYSSPAVVDGRLYIGSNDNRLYCFNATNGNGMWSFQTGSSVGSPTVADGRVYVGSSDRVYCFDALTGNEIWSYATGKYHSMGSPAVADGKVYVVSNIYLVSEGGRLYCLNATTGSKIWNFTTQYSMGSPSIAGNRVYIGSDDRRVYCLNALTGNEIWNYRTLGYVGSSPAVAGDRVYVGDDSWQVYCLNAMTGSLIWSYRTDGPMWSSPVVADGKVYFVPWYGSAHCLNATTGAEVWVYGRGYGARSSPAVAYGRVYVGSRERVYAFGSADTQIPTSISCSVSPSEVAEGSSVIVSGYINPPLRGKTLTLTYRKPDGSSFNRTPTTGFNGSYWDSYQPDVTGSWGVIVTWTSESIFVDASSSKNFTVIMIDTDGDGVYDVEDAFPFDASEWLDTDRDSVGNNADSDDDGDKMPDAWETANGLNPLNATDASLDKDGDGLTNLQEYQNNTNPNNYFSPLPLWIIGLVFGVGVGIVIGAAITVRVRKAWKAN